MDSSSRDPGAKVASLGAPHCAMARRAQERAGMETQLLLFPPTANLQNIHYPKIVGSAMGMSFSWERADKQHAVGCQGRTEELLTEAFPFS